MSDPSVTSARPSSGRRKFLKLVGGGIVVAATGAGVFAATRTPSKALEPWKLAIGTDAPVDPRRIILSHAILAPNPHNRQPWLADLSRDGEITLFCDLERRLPHTDPFDRQITIGLGCFLELADITARQIGYRTDINLFPKGEGQPRLDESPVARIVLTKDEAVSRDPLFAQIFDRRSAKDPYDAGKSVSAESVQEILSVVDGPSLTGSVLDEQNAADLRKLAWDAMETELRTYRTAKESIDLLRIGKKQIEANPDGIDLGGAFFEVANALGMMNREEFLDTNSTAFQQQMSGIREPFQTANGFVYVKSLGNRRTSQIAAGRAYVRINLKATELGVAMQPWSQALQEFEEVKPYYDAIRGKLGIADNETLQMFARIGYAERPGPSPRWGYETRIRNL
ncbi:MAG: nitroreductase family protein [Pseudomonadota bacterium]